MAQYRNIIAATVTLAKIEELLEAVFSVRYVPTEGERSPLKVATKQRLMKTEETLCVL
jgi:hypothetical protein